MPGSSASKRTARPKSKNPFDLAKRGSVGRRSSSLVARPAKARIVINSERYSTDEIKQFLVGYEELPPAQWATLKHRQHIRYVRTEGNVFVRGGFIIGFPERAGEAFITLANGFDRSAEGYAYWTISIGKIQTIFVKVGPES